MENRSADALSRNNQSVSLPKSGSSRESDTYPYSASRGPGAPEAGLDIRVLHQSASRLFAKGLAESTQRAYGSAQRRYQQFCRQSNLRPIPATETVLSYYVAHLAGEGLKHRTIKAYLSAIRFLQISEGKGDQFRNPLHRLRYILQGVKREEVRQGAGRRERLPVTPNIMHKIKAVWQADSHDQDMKMLWAAVYLGFFGFLQTGEMTVPSDTGFDPKTYLTPKDLSFNFPRRPTVMRVTIKSSKTDPFRKGMDIFVGKTEADLCLVTAMLRYLVERGWGPGPLFKFRDGRVLTRQRLVEAMKSALQKAGMDAMKYCGHSFRIGAATSAATAGMEDAVIKTRGRWRSLAYLEYIKIPREQLANYSKKLAGA